MTAGGELVVGVVITFGLIGIAVPFLPGVAVVIAALAFWAYDVGTREAWAVFGIATTAVVISQVAKYALPRRRLREAGVPPLAIAVGAAAGLVGFFVIPVIGLLVGFVGGIYVTMLRRGSDQRTARNATYGALKAVGLSLLAELAGGLLAASTWLLAVLFLT